MGFLTTGDRDDGSRDFEKEHKTQGHIRSHDDRDRRWRRRPKTLRGSIAKFPRESVSNSYGHLPLMVFILLDGSLLLLFELA